MRKQNLAEVESTFLFLFPPFFILPLFYLIGSNSILSKRKEGEGLVTDLLILSVIFFTPSHVNN